MQDILESGKRLRVAAYCRVSTAKEEQESSYEIQVAFFKEMIAYHPNWEMTEVYADYGITGTSIEKRKDFSRMMEDCKVGKIDLILVKSLSRFARNTIDSLNCIRMLKERNIGVWFDEERINTLDQSGEMLITVLSALAQEIWQQHFTPIIGAGQVAYTLEKFQSPSAIERQIQQEHYEYFLLVKKVNWLQNQHNCENVVHKFLLQYILV